MIENEIVHPSPALVVRSDVPVLECLRKMRDFRVGSILVVSADEKEKLVGIFTERDVVDHADEMRDPAFWNQPISAVMTSPVQTLPMSRLWDAAQVMLKNGFRHLPIVTPKGSLLGLVSMRDLFTRFSEQSTGRRFAPGFRKPVRIGVVEPGPEMDPEFYRNAMKMLNAKSVRLASPELSDPTRKRQIESLDAIILDLDYAGADAWIELLKKSRPDLRLPFTVILFTPTLHPGRRVRALLRLSNAEHLAVFARPVNLVTFLRRVRSAL